MPPFRPDTQWIGPPPGAVERICARGPLLVQFIDAAHLSNVEQSYAFNDALVGFLTQR